ncbi:LysM domain-containing protein [Flavobacterium swingsii]|uniref:LysM domain-containing protein n=1 Tax=Flavobacterium swingsii TaxID=498292 RepID=A0A1I0WI24_9FLAO|nr:LysM peptidoglycan-binding domain-containing protein [Flavobacterium swingsii]SFA88291.1 LysM domain-containing protein [Flavobacterium swingsii]
MKYLIYIVCFLFLSTNLALAQSTNLIKHKVQKGETIAQISIKYSVTPSDIYKLNPDAQKGVEENTILIIPNKAKVKVEIPSNSTTKKHTVLAKETLYSLSKLYNVSISDIEKANVETLKEGVKIGMVLMIPAKGKSIPVEKPKPNNPKTAVYHEVKAKETKYAIAKQYEITIEQLEKLNPEIVNIELPIGFKLLINGEKINVAPKPIIVNVPTPKPSESLYVIKAKETLYSISNQFEVTQEELLALNPELKDGVIEGMSIKVPMKSSVLAMKKEYKDLTKSIQKGTNKKLALLLPFNLTKLDQDTINSTKARLKKDKFLNMTLDFYAGALVAIDSVRKMGLNVDVTILDSNETKSTSNVTSLVQENNLKIFDAIIGPFYQNNVEKTASLLSASNVPVFSPLSKDYDKKFPNLVQATPSVDDIKNAIFDFMRAKNGNMIAIVDPKKASVKQYISENHKDVLFAQFTEKGSLDIENLKSMLVKDKTNFVIMETEKTNLILSITNTLASLLPNYDIKLVILGENDALDYEEIAMTRLTKLKMHYPSLTRVNESDEANIFENSFKRKNKIVPNQFATRGFDVTFDVLLRLTQEKNITETLNETATEQVENRFYYKQNPDGGYTNKGVYILYYDTDLTIKEAK